MSETQNKQVTITLSAAEPSPSLAASWPLAAVAIVCAVLAGLLSRGFRKSIPTVPKWRRVALAAALPIVPILALLLLAMTMIENVSWSAKLVMMVPGISFAIVIGIIFCLPVALLAARNPKQRDLPEIFD